MSKIKVLCILNNLNVCNGIASYVMNYFKNIDREKVRMDFLISEDSNSLYVDYIKSTKSRLYIMPEMKMKSMGKFLKSVDDFFKRNNQYDIVHCHLANAAVFYLGAAKKYGIESRILHSHATKSADKPIRKLRNDLMIPFSRRMANINFACTKAAGDFLFKDEYYIVNNAIEVSRFIYNEEIRNLKRRELGITDEFVIGNVGRFAAQKNPLFMIEIFKEITKINKNSILLLIGDGPMEEKIRLEINKNSLRDKVIILSKRNDINELYQAMDVFVLPSIYEGLGIVYIESQASGLKTFGSNKVPKEARVSELMEFINLKESPKIWAEKIVKYNKNYLRYTPIEDIEENGYSIEVEANKMQEIYFQLVERTK